MSEHNCESCDHKCGRQPDLKIDPEQVKNAIKSLKRESWLFLVNTNVQYLVRGYNLQKQVIMEVTFDERNVPNPDVEKRKINEYVR